MLGLVGALTLCAAPGAVRVLNQPQKNILDSSLPPNRLVDGIEYAAELIPEDAATIVVVVEARTGDLLTPTHRRALRELVVALNALPFVDAARTQGLASFALVRDREGTYRVDTHPLAEDAVADLAAWKRDVGESYAFGRLISKDWKAAPIVLHLIEPFEEIAAADAVRALAARFSSDTLEVGTTGPRVLDAEISVLVKEQIRVLFPLALAGVFGFFGLLLGSTLGGVICLLPILTAILWTCGILDLFGYRFNVVTSTTPVFIVALGSYPFHILCRFRDAAREHPEDHVARVRRSLSVRPAIAMAAATSIGGFATLGVFAIDAVREMSVCIPVGVIALTMATLMIVPAMELLFGAGRLLPNDGLWVRLTTRLSDAIVRFSEVHAGMVVRVMLLSIPLLAAWIVLTVEVGTEPIDYLLPENRVRIAHDTMGRHFAAADGMPFVVVFPDDGALLDPHVQEQLAKLDTALAATPRVSRVDSLSTILRMTREEFGRPGTVPTDPKIIRSEIGMYRRQDRAGYFQNVSHPDLRATRFFLMTDASDSNRALEALIEDVRAHVTSIMPEAEVFPVGARTRWVAQHSYIVPGKMKNMALAVLVAFVVCGLCGYYLRGRRGTFAFATICVVPPIVLTLVTFALFPIFGFRIELANLVISSLVLGVCPDFAIHVALRRESAPVIMGDALSNAVGFAVIPLFSKVAPVAVFGGIVTVTMVFAPILTLLWVSARLTRASADERRLFAPRRPLANAALVVFALGGLLIAPGLTRAESNDDPTAREASWEIAVPAAPSVESFLELVAHEASVETPMRADIVLETSIFGRTSRDQAIRCYRPGPRVQTYTELRDDGSKMLELGADAADRYYDPAIGNVPFEFTHDQNFAGTDFTKEDLEQFFVADFDATLLRRDTTTLTVELRPKKSTSYERRVETFDAEKRVPTRVVFFRAGREEPIKTLDIEDYARIGGRWRPAVLRMRDHEANSASVLRMTWTVVENMPGRLFNPASMQSPSGLTWPAPSDS